MSLRFTSPNDFEYHAFLKKKRKESSFGGGGELPKLTRSKDATTPNDSIIQGRWKEWSLTNKGTHAQRTRAKKRVALQFALMLSLSFAEEGEVDNEAGIT